MTPMIDPPRELGQCRLAVATVAGLLPLAAAATAQSTMDYPIRPVPFSSVAIEGGFWGPRVRTNRDVTVRYDFEKCEATGRIANFARAGGLEEGGFQGIPYNDSDVYKVIEGASYSLALAPDAQLDAYLDELIVKIAAAQEDDGYLYTARTLGVNDGFTGPERWSNLRSNHELYNVGHLYEAAVAHHRATGKRALLDVALKNADLIARVFGPGEGQRVEVPGHQEIEIGLVKLYRLTGEERYFDLARFFLDTRGRASQRELYGEYCQDHQPVTEQEAAVGHAVRAGYMYAAMADMAALTGDQRYTAAIDRIWSDITSCKMHVTGGVGARRGGESFGAPYELPNATAYDETCAAIAFALFNQRMFLLHGDAQYVDVLARILYNGFLSGVSLSGDRFFYPNPLACDGLSPFNQGTLGRSPWFDCSCCPVNVVRFVPSIAGYVYAQRESDVWVNLYVAGSGEVALEGGEVELVQTTDYPWRGRVRITVRPPSPQVFTLRLRIPGWARGEPAPGGLYRYLADAPENWTLSVGGEPLDVPLEQGYAVVRREWRPGDTVELELPMPVRRVVADERVAADRGRVALERGPIVYCLEGADHGGRIAHISLPDDAKLASEHRAELLGGVTVVTAEGRAARRTADGALATDPVRLTAIPYFAWAHRAVGEMAVWLPRDPELARPRLAPTIASTCRASASHVYAGDTVEALHDQREPASSGDHSLPRFTWWDRQGTTEWVQYEADAPIEVRECRVYWFDDTGRGRCRVPRSWRVLYRVGDAWRPVEGSSDYGTEPDRFNAVTFEPVTTGAIRIEAVLAEGFSAGILEWEVR